MDRGRWFCWLLVWAVLLGACSDDDGGDGGERATYLDRSPAQLVADALSDSPSVEFLAVRGRVNRGVSKARRSYTRSFVLVGGRGRALVDDAEITIARRQTAIAVGVSLDSIKEQNALLANATLDVLLAEVQRRLPGATSCAALGQKADDCVVALLLIEVQRSELRAGLDAGTPAQDASSAEAGFSDAARPALDGAIEAAVSDGAADGGSPSRDGASDTGDAALGDAALLPLPQVSALTPATTTAATDVSLIVQGSGFVAGAVIYVDRNPLPSTVQSASALQATVSAAITATPGDLAVYVENRPGDIDSRSNTLYLRVQPAPGAPVLYDYSPDNGVAGETVLLIGNNLQGENLTVRDANGALLTTGAVASLTWPNVGTASSLSVVLPANVATGPIVVSSSLGSFRGKVFNVGQNLTKLPGTVVTSSSEYNTTNWSRVSGADNSLRTSFFTAIGDCASLTSCTLKPWFRVSFASPQAVQRIAMRGNREYAAGYDFVRGTFTLFGAGDTVLWQGSYGLPEPDRDLDIALADPVPNVVAAQFSSLEDQSSEPGFSELELFAP